MLIANLITYCAHFIDRAWSYLYHIARQYAYNYHLIIVFVKYVTLFKTGAFFQELNDNLLASFRLLAHDALSCLVPLQI